MKVRTRGGFTVHPLVLLLGLIVLMLGAYKGWVIWSMPAHTAYAAGYKVGAMASPLILLGIASALGWIAYRACGRSEGAGNAAAGLVLAAVTAIWGYQIGNYLVNGPKQRVAQRSSPSDPREAVRQRPEPPPAPRAANPGTTAPRPTAPRPPAPRTTPPSAPPPSNPASAVIPPGPPPVREAESPRIKEVLGALTTELDAAAGALSVQAETVLDSVAKPPAHSKPAIEQRLKDLESLRAAAENLKERLLKTGDEAKKRLGEAGVSETEAFSASVRYSVERRDALRAMACDEYARLGDSAREEAAYLLENISKWNLDAKGTVTSRDVAVKGRASGLRMLVDAALGRRAEIGARLRGE